VLLTRFGSDSLAPARLEDRRFWDDGPLLDIGWFAGAPEAPVAPIRGELCWTDGGIDLYGKDEVMQKAVTQTPERQVFNKSLCGGTNSEDKTPSRHNQSSACS
jgi:hypothetical protein